MGSQSVARRTASLLRLGLLVTAAAGLLAAGCARPAVDLGGNSHEVLDELPKPNNKLDVLFMVDNSPGMAPRQKALIAAKTALFSELDARLGGPPSLHVGVISSSVRVNDYTKGDPRCETTGDNGYLQGPKPAGVDPQCDAARIQGKFLVDVSDSAGGRTRDFSGDIGDAFACLANLGDQGCGFEEPLESLRRALDGRNPGFLRKDAMLLVVFLTDEDDCSASNQELYDPSNAAVGPYASFRCFNYGVRCDPDDPRTPGVKTNCVARDDGRYFAPLSHFADFLAGLKSDPTRVMLAGIFAPPGHVAVKRGPNVSDPDVVELASACGTSEQHASPGVRLDQLLHQFPARQDSQSICAATLAPGITHIADTVAGVMTARPCLLGKLGAHPVCRAFDVTAPRTPNEVRHDIPRCDGSGARPCFDLVHDPATCPDTDSGMAVTVERDAAPPAGAHLVVDCLDPAQ